MPNSNQNLNPEIKCDLTPEENQKNPWKIGLLCVFLGVFGVHNFYLGNRNKGLLQILWLPVLLLSFIIFKINEMSGLIFVTMGGLLSLVAGLSAFVDVINIARGKFKDGKGTIIHRNPSIIPVYMLWIIFLILIKACIPESGNSVQENLNEVGNTKDNVQPNKNIPVKERNFEALNKCKYENKECEEEYNKRLETAIQTIDSIYAEGDVREAIKLSPTFYKILQSDGTTISFEEIFPTKKGIEKRIDNLLPQKGCIQDSLQYANYLSTIYDIEKILDIDDENLSKIIKKYFSYLNRNCKLPHYDANVIITEERFVKTALNRKDITSTKANALFNDIFKEIDEADFTAMKSMNEGKSFKGYGTVEKKKNRTISYIEAPSKELNDATALAIAAFKVFSFEAYFPFTLHPSVENVEIGFNISELEYNWYAGYYHGIYAVTIKTNKKTLDRYYEKNNIKPPKNIKSDNAMSDDDKNFFAQPLTYSSIKRWCSKNGFVCSKYLVERTK